MIPPSTTAGDTADKMNHYPASSVPGPKRPKASPAVGITFGAGVERAAIAFVVAREAWLLAKRQRRAFKCSEEEGGDGMGHAGIPPCWCVDDKAETYCQECQDRDAIHRTVLPLRKAATKAYRELKREVAKK